MGLIGIFSYLIAIFIRPQDFLPFMLGFPIVDAIAGLTLLIGIIGLIGQKRTISFPQNYFVVLFLLVVFLSNIVNNKSEAGIEQFIFYLKRSAIFFMFLLILNSSEQLKKTINFIIILIVFLAIQSIYQSRYGIGFAGQSLMPGYEEVRVRWVGMWDGPNVLCLLFVLALPFTLEFTFGTYSILYRLINLFFTIILLYGVYLTNSRGGFVGFLSVIFFYLWTKFKDKKKAAVIGLFLSLVFTTFFAPSRMANIRGETSAHERTWIWEQGLNVLKEKPLLGVGKGQFHEVAHNNFIQNITETGLIGIFIFVSLIYLSFKALYIVRRSNFNTNKNNILLNLTRPLLVSMVGFNVVTLFITMELDILFIWLGLCAVALNIARREIGGISFKFSMKDAIAVFFIIIVITLTIYIVAIRDIV